MTVTIVPLISNAILPQASSARTRAVIPSGYGVQEQCLPFTAANALGFVIPSPIRFGLCDLEEVPPGSRAFRSPVECADKRVLYVFDNPDCRFEGNAYSFEGMSVQEPGISFFDRDDQQDLFKLHLPYIWRTPESVDTLFMPLVNRQPRVEVLCGLVETDWYSSPVNLILRRPSGSVHFGPGDPVAQAILVPRELRKPALEIAQSHARVTREARKDLVEWDKQHAADRGVYKVLARSRHGRVDSQE